MPMPPAGFSPTGRGRAGTLLEPRAAKSNVASERQRRSMKRVGMPSLQSQPIEARVLVTVHRIVPHWALCDERLPWALGQQSAAKEGPWPPVVNVRVRGQWLDQTFSHRTQAKAREREERATLLLKLSATAGVRIQSAGGQCASPLQEAEARWGEERTALLANALTGRAAVSGQFAPGAQRQRTSMWASKEPAIQVDRGAMRSLPKPAN